ncbi:MAG: DUF4405 domain-containing protein [Hyphomicrobiaceae bacterium]|nr:DUF4405 domain-containing protein [Hyphomicrobiaceae bacterium]
MVRSAFHWRSFVSLLTTTTFLVMIFTSLAVYIDPVGRIAFWIDWRFLGLDKEAWGGLHTVIGYAFLLIGFVHVVLNWKPLKAYIVEHAHGLAVVRLREAIAATVATIIVVAGTIGGWPPFSYVDWLGSQLEERWAAMPGAEPPVPHAETLTVEALARLLGFNGARAVESLKAAGLGDVSQKDALGRIAVANDRTPAEVYAVISAGERAAQAQAPAKVWSAAELDTRYGGTGIGRRSVVQLAEEFGLTPAVVQQRLAGIGIAARGEDRLKDLGDKAGLDAMELFKTVLIEGYRPPGK